MRYGRARMRDRLLLIVNRAAGLGLRPDVEETPSWWREWPWELSAPGTPEELRQFCDSITPDNYDGVFFAGGDGTFHQALPSLVGKGLRLGVLPGGTANDLANELGTSLNWDHVRKLVSGNTEPMDLIGVNGSFIATVGGTGVGALLCDEINSGRMRSRRFRRTSAALGDHVYTILTAKIILSRRDYVHEVDIRSREFSGRVKTSALFVCNQGRLGKYLSVAPEARNNDGRFDVLVITQTRQTALLKALLDLRSGRLPEGAIRFSTGEMTVTETSGRGIPVFGDGEVIPASERLEFSILPAALSVYRRQRADLVTR